MKNKYGFTLIEMLAVVLIVAILTAVGLPQYRRVVEKAHISEAEVMMRSIYDSGERLAGEFGYRSFSQFAAREPSKATFKRLDMFDNPPSGCRFVNDDKQMDCARFSYKLPDGNWVKAKVLTGKLKDSVIGLNTSSMKLSCGGTEDQCDIMGLDKTTLSF